MFIAMDLQPDDEVKKNRLTSPSKNGAKSKKLIDATLHSLPTNPDEHQTVKTSNNDHRSPEVGVTLMPEPRKTRHASG